MDKFMVDLDSVLDELEAEESNTPILETSESSLSSFVNSLTPVSTTIKSASLLSEISDLKESVSHDSDPVSNDVHVNQVSGDSIEGKVKETSGWEPSTVTEQSDTNEVNSISEFESKSNQICEQESCVTELEKAVNVDSNIIGDVLQIKPNQSDESGCAVIDSCSDDYQWTESRTKETLKNPASTLNSVVEPSKANEENVVFTNTLPNLVEPSLDLVSESSLEADIEAPIVLGIDYDLSTPVLSDKSEDHQSADTDSLCHSAKDVVNPVENDFAISNPEFSSEISASCTTTTSTTLSADSEIIAGISASVDPSISETIVSQPCALESNNHQTKCEPLIRPSSLRLPISSVNPNSGDQIVDDSSDDAIGATFAESDNMEPASPASISNDGLQNGNSCIDSDFIVGRCKPFWIPDQEAPACMSCDAKFTVIKRRHHCRACGKVLCSQCCNEKAKLPYLDFKEARVCRICLPLLSNDDPEEGEARGATGGSFSNSAPMDANASSSSQGNSSSFSSSPNPNNPAEYCSSIPPLEQAGGALGRPPPTVFVPVGVLKRGDKPRGEPKQVVFSDGIRPGSDLSEPDTPQAIPVHHRQLKRLKSPSIEKTSPLGGSLKLSKLEKKRAKSNRITIIDTNGPLPPVINCAALAEDPTAEKLVEILGDENQMPVIFYLTKNLHAAGKVVHLDCCMQTTCWVFASKGLASVGQDEIIIAIEKYANEILVPRDAFRLLTSVYDSASRGCPFGEMSHIIFTEGLFDNKDNGGFMFIRPTFQCLTKFILPSPPFLVAILIHKFEIPWAKILPLRLLLRLGAEFNYYPCPLVSYRDRKPTYCEIGHTIMNVLADFRNFQYTLPFIPGLVVHSEDKSASVSIPRNRYEHIMKALGSSNEHVLALGTTFSLEADSHLTCIQNDDGQYQTGLEKDRSRVKTESQTVTGTSFIVFSGALKSSTGLSAKMSIVEDGILVQIPPNTMEELRNSLKNMQDMVIKCGKVDSPESAEAVNILWTKEDKNFNMGVRSLIDNMSLEGVYSVRIYNGTDYASEKYFIRWTEVFFIQNEDMSKRGDSVDPTKLAGVIAQSLCLALTPHLDHLVDNNLLRIALRVTLDPEKVGYEVGSNGQSLPNAYVNELDGALIPVIMGNVAANIESVLVIELVFHILIK